MTYTVAILEVSAAAYDEIAKKLRDADYDHVFIDAGTPEEHIDMTHIALRPLPERLDPHDPGPIPTEPQIHEPRPPRPL